MATIGNGAAARYAPGVGLAVSIARTAAGCRLANGALATGAASVSRVAHAADGAATTVTIGAFERAAASTDVQAELFTGSRAVMVARGIAA